MIRSCPHGPARPVRRPGFTLLEVLLAALLAALVLAAVYTLFNVTLQQTQAGRDSTEVENLARGVFNKISNDLNGTLAPLPPKTGGNSAAGGGLSSSTSSGSSGSGSSSTASGSGTSGSGSGSSTSGSGSSTSSSPSATDNATAVAGSYPFEGGLIGDDGQKMMAIYTARTPDIYGRYSNANDQLSSDQRQVIYWFVEGSGLYRRERPWVTDTDVNANIDMDATAPETVLLAEEVTAATFEFTDGVDWYSSWDGTQPGPDGVTPQGAPRAVRLTLTFQFSVGSGPPISKTMQQVLAINPAPGLYTPTPQSPPTDGGSGSAITTSGSTSSTSSSSGAGAGGSSSSSSAGKAGATSGGTSSGTSGGSSGGGSTGGTGSGSAGGSGKSSGTGGTAGGTSGSTGGGK
jgi:prepilin-type N-terminal cleavage/methylation domain-containing protein